MCVACYLLTLEQTCAGRRLSSKQNGTSVGEIGMVRVGIEVCHEVRGVGLCAVVSSFFLQTSLCFFPSD